MEITKVTEYSIKLSGDEFNAIKRFIGATSKNDKLQYVSNNESILLTKIYGEMDGVLHSMEGDLYLDFIDFIANKRTVFNQYDSELMNMAKEILKIKGYPERCE